MRINLHLSRIGMGSAQWPDSSCDWMQLTLGIYMKTSHVGRSLTRVSRIQDIKQTASVSQTNGTISAGGKDARQGELPIMDVDDRYLVASRIHGKEPLPLACKNERSLRAIGKGRQTAQATDGDRAKQGERTIGGPIEDGERVGAAQIIIQDIDMPSG